jgi:hypothetical protein
MIQERMVRCSVCVLPLVISVGNGCRHSPVHKAEGADRAVAPPKVSRHLVHQRHEGLEPELVPTCPRGVRA